MKRSKFTDEQILAIVKEGEKFRLLCDRGRGELRGGEAARHPGPGLGDVVDTRGAARCRERLRWEPGAEQLLYNELFSSVLTGLLPSLHPPFRIRLQWTS